MHVRVSVCTIWLSGDPACCDTSMVALKRAERILAISATNNATSATNSGVLFNAFPTINSQGVCLCVKVSVCVC